VERRNSSHQKCAVTGSGWKARALTGKTQRLCTSPVAWCGTIGRNFRASCFAVCFCSGPVSADGGSDDHFHFASAAEAGLDAGSDRGVSGGDPLIPLLVKFGGIGEVGKVDDDLQQ